MNTRELEAFRKKIQAFYTVNGRGHLPWRSTRDPYSILVSEIMLQQTQVDRVVPKYTAFIETFPTVQSLAEASLKDVLSLWKGLGYNRRARFLHSAAKEIVAMHNGVFPRTYETLLALPGVGPYTAGAVSVFAFRHARVLLETNIRTVYLHEFFPNQERVSDAELLPYIEATVDTKNPHEWYAALMDYGAFLKRTVPNPSRKSAHHTRQSPFSGSLRQVRGMALGVLIGGTKTLSAIAAEMEISETRVEQALIALSKDGLVQKQRGRWRLAT